ncbi:hypothetical protein ACIRBX_00330 [Kitasatospora sp. NPDC096147]|uniref:hypothetical protein n=1 Tax=Kitasatospora sp. NPDC096147 TaxID=3364093 RepID=UPI0038243D92
MTTPLRLLAVLGTAATVLPLLSGAAAAAPAPRGVHASTDDTVLSRNDDGSGTGWLIAAQHTTAAEYLLG